MKRLLSLLILIFMVFSSTLPFWIKNDSNNINIEEIKQDSKPRITVVKIIKSEIEIATENAQKELEEINNISDKKEWFVAYKNIIDKYSYILDPPETIYDYCIDEEINLICRVVETETYQCEFNSKVNVANVVFNRLEHGEFGETIEEVITSENQFAYGRKNISEDTILAVEYAFMMEDTTNGALFFHSNKKTSTFCGNEFIFQDEAGHNFY